MNKISWHPETYPTQQGLSCGEYNARTIIRGSGATFKAMDHMQLRIKLFGFSFPKDIVRLLQLNGLEATINNSKQFGKRKKIEIIKSHIDNNEPVICAIGNGHIKRGRYNGLARLFIGHFITVLGYCEKNECFYIYDSYLKGNYPEELPVGNEIRSFNVFLRDWAGPVYYNLIGMKYLYIPVRNRL